MDLEWKEPPPKGNGDVDRVVQLLKQNPGKWARVSKDMASSGAGAKWRKAGCDIAVRPAEKPRADGKSSYDVYARWTGPEGGQAEAAQAPRQAVAPPPQTAARPTPPPQQTTGDAGLDKFMADRAARQTKGTAAHRPTRA